MTTRTLVQLAVPTAASGRWSPGRAFAFQVLLTTALWLGAVALVARVIAG